MEKFPEATLESLVRQHLPDAAGPLSFEPITTGWFNASYFVRADGEDIVQRDLLCRT